MDRLRKILGYARLEKIALEIYDRMPVIIKYGKTFLYWLSFLKESEYWDSDRIKTYQLERLKSLLIHAGKNIPYYKILFSNISFRPDRLQSIEDLKILPFLDRRHIKDKTPEFIDRHNKSKITVSTSGSTGIPLTVYMSRESRKFFYAFLFHSLSRCGYNLKSKTVSFWNKISINGKRDLPYIKIGNRLILSMRYLSEEFQNFFEVINSFEPSFITGYSSALYIFSALIIKNRLKLKKRPISIIGHGETIYDWQRDLIERAFDCRLFSVYSMTEGGIFASECEYSSAQHIYPQSGIVEFIPIHDGYTEIVTTGLINPVMPFLRYKTGDIGIKGSKYCSLCRRNHILIEKIHGRTNDFLVDKRGRIIPRIMPWIKIFPNTERYQFFQEVPGKVLLKIVKTEDYNDIDTLFIKKKLIEMLGPMSDFIDISIIFVDDIPASNIGKINLVDQRLDIREFIN